MTQSESNQVAHSDALVIFGASGDLARKMLYPALYRLAAGKRLDIPVIGVAERAWTQPQYVAHVRESIQAATDVFDSGVFETIAQRLRYVTGDIGAATTFASLREALAPARHPLLYLAIPPRLFAVAVEQLARAQLARGSRVAVEKPFGHDLASAQALGAALTRAFGDSAIFRVDHFLAAEPVANLLYFRCANPFAAAVWMQPNVASVQITMAEDFGIDGRGSFFDRVGALRDVVQNHLMQVLAMIAMEPPERLDADAMHRNRIALLQAVQPVTSKAIVRGQFEGYGDIEGVSPGSDTETYVALRLVIDTPRWQGVPFCIRAGKRMPLTATNVTIELQPAPDRACADSNDPNRFRFALGPGPVEIGVEARAKRHGSDTSGQAIELAAQRGRYSHIDAYERLLHDAWAGDHSVFERQAAIEAAWRIFEPLRKAEPAVESYAGQTWGPPSAARIAEPSGWFDPRPDDA